MAFASSVSVNVDAVTEETIANASGDVLFQLGKSLFAEVSRLRCHAERAQAALDDAHTAPRHIQDAVGAELAAAQERMERLFPLAMKATLKFEAEAVTHFGLRRRRPAIDLMSCDSWDVIDDAASVFDVDNWSNRETQSSSPTAANPWVPRDGSSHARHQLRDLIHRQVLQRQGRGDIPPSRVVHVSPFDDAVDEAALKRLMVHHGFDVDEESRVVEYTVTSSHKGREHHYYGFVTFLHMSAAERCVRQLDPMGLDGHGGMTPIRRRNDKTFGHVKLTFSFSNNEKINADAVRQIDALGAHAGRTSSRAAPGRRQPRAATPARRQPSRSRHAYDSDSDETRLEDH